MAIMDYRVDLDFIGLGNAAAAYGGHLRAWSFRDIQGPAWFEAFRQQALASIGRRHLPIYRMADGEYRFLFGRRINWARKPLIRELMAVGAEKTRLVNPDKWKTSWGEVYPPSQTRLLREQLVGQIRQVSASGFLACYINDNGLNAFTEYNSVLLDYLGQRNIALTAANYIPFHFAPSLLIGTGWQDFVRGRRLLVATGLTDEKEAAIRATLMDYGASEVLTLPTSSNSALTDTIEPSDLSDNVDIALVAAGIGSANILCQLKPLNTLCIDIGGLMNCFADRTQLQHGGVVGLPNLS